MTDKPQEHPQLETLVDPGAEEWEREQQAARERAAHPTTPEIRGLKPWHRISWRGQPYSRQRL